MTGPDGFRAGFVAVVGRPNVGKSTLINALIGSKVSIVTPKPQTTRHRILGVLTEPAFQAIFVDTPGMHRNAGKAINRMMNKTAVAALADADVILFVSEANRFRDEDGDVVGRLAAAGRPVIAVLNKIDLVKPKSRVLAALADVAARHEFVEVIPVSARRRDNLDRLVGLLPAWLPESPPLFPDDMLTDRGDQFRIAEIIREKLTLHLRDELPYGLTVQIEKVEQENDRLVVHALIWVERDSQKGIVVGKGGSMLKTVGRSARLDIERMLGTSVHLELWAKVKDNWANSEKDLQSLGFDIP